VKQLHTVDYHLRLLDPVIDSTVIAPSLVLSIPEQPRVNANQLRARNQVGDRYIVFHPGSARAEKFWDAKRWAEVIEYAAMNHGMDLLLTGDKSALEQNHLREIKAETRTRVVDLSGQTDLLTLAALIEKAQLLVTVDSAALHLAAATQTRQIALFGPTNPFHWRPRDKVSAVLQGPSPVPLREFSANQAPSSMKEISTEAVIDAMDALLPMPVEQGS
jgi:ADP-heptose:LPS heptosyltransferase